MRTVFTLCIGCFLGYIARDSYLARNYAHTIKQAVLGEQKQTSADTFISEIIYENGTFSPGNVMVKKGNYLSITNRSDSLMWLVSDNPTLTTPRGLGNSEQLRVKANTEGTYVLENKLNQNARTVVTIIP